MYAIDYAKQERGVPAVIAIAVNVALIYLLATGLGVVPSIRPSPPMTLVDVPAETVKPQLIEKTQIDNHDLIDRYIHIDTLDKTVIVIDTRDEPTIDDHPPIVDGGTGDLNVEQPMTNVRLLKKLEPPYPNFSRLAGEEGTVFVKVNISSYGSVGEVQIEKSSGFVRLDEAALKAVRTWRFAPATRGSQAITTWVVVPVKYVLNSHG